MLDDLEGMPQRGVELLVDAARGGVCIGQRHQVGRRRPQGLGERRKGRGDVSCRVGLPYAPGGEPAADRRQVGEVGGDRGGRGLLSGTSTVPDYGWPDGLRSRLLPDLRTLSGTSAHDIEEAAWRGGRSRSFSTTN